MMLYSFRVREEAIGRWWRQLWAGIQLYQKDLRFWASNCSPIVLLVPMLSWRWSGRIFLVWCYEKCYCYWAVRNILDWKDCLTGSIHFDDRGWGFLSCFQGLIWDKLFFFLAIIYPRYICRLWWHASGTPSWSIYCCKRRRRRHGQQANNFVMIFLRQEVFVINCWSQS